MARWWQLKYFFNKFIPKIGENIIPNLTILYNIFKIGLVQQPTRHGVFVVRLPTSTTNLLCAGGLQRILEKLARLTTLAEVPMKAVTENELEHLGWGWWGGQREGDFQWKLKHFT